jgi:hypothetical protein
MEPQSFIERILFCTLRTELLDDNNQPKGIGTGFLLSVDLPNEDNKGLVLLVSNRHIFEGSKRCKILFHKRKGSLNEPNLDYVGGYYYHTTDYTQVLFCHPNPNIDLACLNISSVISQLLPQIYWKSLDRSLFASFNEEYLDAGDRVIFIGYPENRYDQVHNLPVLRSGVIASHPKLDFNGQKQFLIDAQVFPGSSGSPVFLNVKEAQFNRGHIILGAGLPYLFLGVVSSTMIRHNVIDFVPANFIPTLQEVIGLGLVFKATALVELIDFVVNAYGGNR